MIIIVDYGTGNLMSVKNMFKKIGVKDVLISNSKSDIECATKIVLPGVGHFDYGMNKLRESGLLEVLNQRVLVEKIPVLGICLGAQLLTNGSEEGSLPGLGWINAQTIKFNTDLMKTKLPIPNMGWCDTFAVANSKLTLNLTDNLRYYFVHSFHMKCFDSQNILFESEYGYKFTSGIYKENIFGVQFHPEKSHKFGMKIFENFSML